MKERERERYLPIDLLQRLEGQQHVQRVVGDNESGLGTRATNVGENLLNILDNKVDLLVRDANKVLVDSLESELLEEVEHGIVGVQGDLFSVS